MHKIEMQSTSTPVNSRGEVRLVTLAKGNLGRYFLVIFSETNRLMIILFHMKPVCDERKKDLLVKCSGSHEQYGHHGHRC